MALGALVYNTRIAIKQSSITLLDGGQMHSIHTGDLDMSQLSKTTRNCHIIPGLATFSPLLAVKLYNAGYNVVFTKFGIEIEERCRGPLVLTGNTCTRTGLWMVPLEDTTMPPHYGHTCARPYQLSVQAFQNQTVGNIWEMPHKQAHKLSLQHITIKPWYLRKN